MITISKQKIIQWGVSFFETRLGIFNNLILGTEVKLNSNGKGEFFLPDTKHPQSQLFPITHLTNNRIKDNIPIKYDYYLSVLNLSSQFRIVKVLPKGKRMSFWVIYIFKSLFQPKMKAVYTGKANSVPFFR